MVSPSVSVSFYGYSDEGTAQNVSLSNNHAGGSGGAASLWSEINPEHSWGTLSAMLSYAVLSNNVAQDNGGALSVYADTSASIYLSIMTLTNNVAQNNGGAIFIRSHDYASVYLSGGQVIEDLTTTVSGNQARADGGGVWMMADVYATLYIQGMAKVDDNSAAGKGGGAPYIPLADTTSLYRRCPFRR